VAFLRAAGFFTPEFRTPFGFTTRQLDAAQGTAEGLDFTLVVVLLVLGEFDEFEDFFHLLQRMFEGFDDLADFVGGFTDGGKILFLARPVGRRTFKAGLFNGRPFHGGLFNRWRFRRFFLRCGWG
jgi:hypothetical protein